MTTIPTKSRRGALRLMGTAAAACMLAPLARAQNKTRLMLGYTSVGDYASGFAAREEGYFDKRGLDVEFKLVPLNPALPAALESDSLQIAGPTPSVFLQSVDGGLDHVILAGAGATARTMAAAGIVARADSNIKTAQDCVGRKIGVPGLGALLHVVGRAWLKSQGVDYTKVTFVESAFPQHADVLRGGSVDAVITADPFMARIVSTGIGHTVTDFTTFFPEGLPTLLFVARREWVKKNVAAAKAFHASVVEGAAFVNKPENMEKTREYISRYVKMPPQVLSTIRLSPAGPTVTTGGLGWWADAMAEQKMLRNRPDLSRLILG
jgi:NitT/TauT family transport system substrate-binding protein